MDVNVYVSTYKGRDIEISVDVNVYMCVHTCTHEGTHSINTFSPSTLSAEKRLGIATGEEHCACPVRNTGPPDLGFK